MRWLVIRSHGATGLLFPAQRAFYMLIIVPSEYGSPTRQSNSQDINHWSETFVVFVLVFVTKTTEKYVYVEVTQLQIHLPLVEVAAQTEIVKVQRWWFHHDFVTNHSRHPYQFGFRDFDPPHLTNNGSSSGVSGWNCIFPSRSSSVILARLLACAGVQPAPTEVATMVGIMVIIDGLLLRRI